MSLLGVHLDRSLSRTRKFGVLQADVASRAVDAIGPIVIEHRVVGNGDAVEPVQ
jgi:hypothetical protein